MHQQGSLCGWWLRCRYSSLKHNLQQVNHMKAKYWDGKLRHKEGITPVGCTSPYLKNLLRSIQLINLTCWCVESVIHRGSREFRGRWTLVTNPVIMISSLSVRPFTEVFLEVTFRWAADFIWLITTVCAEITDFSATYALSIRASEGKLTFWGLFSSEND